MLLHDVAIQKLPVILAVDRAGLVGEDGETHHGLYDVGFLSTVPGLELWAPASFAELKTLLAYAVRHRSGPIAVRYPRGGEVGYSQDHAGEPAVLLRPGTDITLVTYGTMTGIVLDAAEELKRHHLSVRVIKLNRLFPLCPELVEQAAEETGGLCVIEEAACSGSRREVALRQAEHELRGFRHKRGMFQVQGTAGAEVLRPGRGRGSAGESSGE